MSKMPAKKKSCFQITSVTQAQVAASSITDDTESLEDPDESRTEDVSSEIFDACRTDLGVCERSSSEETLNNVGEPQDGQPPTPAPENGGVSHKSTGTGRATPHNLGVPVPATTQAFVPSTASHPAVNSTVPAATVSPVVAHTAHNASCSSRFRVIKLDHGTGEPFRRGRWTCTEFYERDSDSNVNRTVDSLKATVTPDHSVDRDSGLGPSSNSVVTSSAFSAQTLENTTDSGYSGAHPTHPLPSEPLQQGYSLAPHLGNGASAFQPTGYSSTASQQQAQVNVQPVAPQNFLSNSLNGVHHGAMHQATPIMPPAMQAQQFAYSTHTTGLSTGQPDYSQQHFVSSTQNLPVSSLPVGPPNSQVPSPLITPAGPGHQGLGGEAASAQGLLLQGGNTSAMAAILQESGQQQHMSQTQPSGGLSTPPAPSSTSHSGVQNATVPSATNNPQGGQSQAPGTGGLFTPQGAYGGATAGLPFIFRNQIEESRLKSDAHPHSAIVVTGKDGIKPFIGEGLNLPSPAVNSLFGIHITMDVDEDSASGASVVAIDNKIEQAMDLVKSHLMYAVREEVEVLKEQIKELYERNSLLERENAVLKSLANTDQLGQVSSQLNQAGGTPPPQHPLVSNDNNNAPLAHREGGHGVPHQPNITSA
ncbi:TSC22 domain family protein 2 isoform X2 [Clinocottus analis]|uniref:TSC22 domain family protein 2 isoform X2 n=1 Tax=Clinocottus analis TaxID=304258 RepID=UPI0035BF962C